MGRLRFALVLSWLGAMACSDTTPKSASFLCASNAECPTDQFCSDGVCTTPIRNEPDASRLDLGNADLGEPPDVTESDAGTEDMTDAGLLPDGMGATDAGADVQDMVIDEPDFSGLSIRIVSPTGNTSFEENDPLAFAAQVEGVENPALDLQVEWTSDVDGSLGVMAPEANGSVALSPASLSPGFHLIGAVVTAPDGTQARDQIAIGVCGWVTISDFDNDLGGWTSYGDAYRDMRGFLELTGNEQNRKGGLFDLNQRLDPGSTHLRFRISTGSCPDPGPCTTTGGGADGFAVSILDVSNPSDIATIFGEAKTGGGLGYGVSGCYGNRILNAVHIEFDTWHNQYNGNTQFHTDPHNGDHIEVTFDGDAGGANCSTASSNLFAPVSLQDNKWHDVEIQISGEQVDVQLDGVTLISDLAQGLQFKGGYIGITGTTGYYSNYHRFDDLAQQPACRFR